MELDTSYDWSDPRTFFLDADEWQDRCELKGDDAHHLVHVLRLKSGSHVRLLDGNGREGIFRIEKVTKRSALLYRLKEWTHPRPASGLILAAAWTKAARKSWIFEKAVEFGATAVWFWQAERSQFPVPDAAKESWRAQMIAGLKQCHNPWLPEMRTLPGGVSELVRAGSEPGITQRHVLLENSLGDSPMLTPDKLACPGHTLCVIGPEGGFAPQEAESLKQAGFSPFSLGRRVLRWETAAVLCLGLHWWAGESLHA